MAAHAMVAFAPTEVPVVRLQIASVLLTAVLAARTWAADAQILTVGIRVRRESVMLGASRGLRVVDGLSGRRLFSKLKTTPMRIVVDPKGFLIEGFGVRSKIRVEPLDGSLLSVDGLPYRGSFVVEEDRFGKVTVINVIDVEQYLYGVIKSEMLISSPMEALKAQAVIARTFALKYKDRYLDSQGFGLTDDTSSQVYTGVRGEDPRGTRAVDETRGMVLTYQGQLVQSYYHSACGGWTLNNEDAWGGSPLPYLRARRCGYCADSPGFAWHVTLPYTTILERLLEAGYRLGAIRSIETSDDPVAHRALLLKIINDHDEVRILGNQFRLAVGADVIKSAFFAVASPKSSAGAPLETAALPSETGEGELKMQQLIGDYLKQANPTRELTLDGCGSGHGVGLCQSGARGLAELGASFREILEFYYRDAAVKTLY